MKTLVLKAEQYKAFYYFTLLINGIPLMRSINYTSLDKRNTALANLSVLINVKVS